jgi:hypothetical protein
MTVPASTPALEAFGYMARDHKSGLGLVDGGKLVANLSVSDLRWVGARASPHTRCSHAKAARGGTRLLACTRLARARGCAPAPACLAANGGHPPTTHPLASSRPPAPTSGLTPEEFPLLLLSAGEFAAVRNGVAGVTKEEALAGKRVPGAKEGGYAAVFAAAPVETVTISSTFEDVLGPLVNKSLHRVFVVDGAGAAVSISALWGGLRGAWPRDVWARWGLAARRAGGLGCWARQRWHWRLVPVRAPNAGVGRALGGWRCAPQVSATHPTSPPHFLRTRPVSHPHRRPAPHHAHVSGLCPCGTRRQAVVGGGERIAAAQTGDQLVPARRQGPT